MSLNGIIFLSAFLLLIGFAVLLVWGVWRDKAKGVSYIQSATSVGSTSGSTHNRYSRKFSLVLGLASILAGGFSYYFWSTTYSPTASYDPASFSQTQAIGLILIGFLFIYRSFLYERK